MAGGRPIFAAPAGVGQREQSMGVIEIECTGPALHSSPGTTCGYSIRIWCATKDSGSGRLGFWSRFFDLRVEFRLKQRAGVGQVLEANAFCVSKHLFARIKGDDHLVHGNRLKVDVAGCRCAASHEFGIFGFHPSGTSCSVRRTDASNLRHSVDTT